MTRIVTTHYRYKRPPRKRKAVALEGSAVVRAGPKEKAAAAAAPLPPFWEQNFSQAEYLTQINAGSRPPLSNPGLIDRDNHRTREVRSCRGNC